jgi:hypothetical protein
MRVACLAVLILLGLSAGTGEASAPSHCTGPGGRGALASFVSAYNRGDFERLDSLIAEEPDFEWYSTNGPGERLRGKAKRRGTLIPYFEARHARHDRLAWRSFQFNGNSPRYGNFQLTMWRATSGFNRGDRFPVWGKGAAICDEDSTRFIVLTFGVPPLRDSE